MIVYVIFIVLLLAALSVLLLPIFDESELPQHVRHRFSGIVAGVFFVGVFALYYVLGSAQLLPLIAEREGKITELKGSIMEDSKSLKSNPRDLAAWVRLGQSFMETGQFYAASNAFKQAVLLSKGNPLIILAYASSLIYEANGKITDDAKKSLEMVLMQQPENPEARYLMAVRNLQDGHQPEAMKEMKELYRSLPLDSPIKKMIDKQIGKTN